MIAETSGIRGLGTYETAILIGLLSLLLVASVHWLATKGRAAPPTPAPRLGLLPRLVWLGTVLCVLLLGATAFPTMLLHGAMHGLPLFVHVLAGGALSVALAFLAITWAWPNRVGRGGDRRFGGLTRLAFWVMVLLGLIASGTMLASTFALTGTEGMEKLLVVHRWSGLGLFVATALHVYLVRRARA